MHQRADVSCVSREPPGTVGLRLGARALGYQAHSGQRSRCAALLHVRRPARAARPARPWNRRGSCHSLDL